MDYFVETGAKATRRAKGEAVKCKAQLLKKDLQQYREFLSPNKTVRILRLWASSGDPLSTKFGGKVGPHATNR